VNAALVVKATGKPMLSGFCAHSGHHELCRLLGCGCSCHRPPDLLPLGDALAQLCRVVCGPPGYDRHDPICQTVRAHLAPTPVGARP
jgi:hypothetical protein